MKNLIVKSFAIVAIAAAFTLPTSAFAGCNQMNGAYAVSCENGVKVYRHQAKSGLPITAVYAPAQARYSASAERRADVALQLEARRVAIEERRQRAEETDLIRTQRGFNRQLRSRRFVAFGGARGGRINRSRANY